MKILITGGAGFIGSNLAENLLKDERVTVVRVLDNFATGHAGNISSFYSDPKFSFIEGDIRDYDKCLEAMKGIDLVSHQAALGSVPRSIADPLTTNQVNITGTLNIFNAARECGVKRVVYAASSSTYGDHPGLPKVEDKIGRPLSPYAITKYVNELYARVFADLYGMQFIGLRYFNIFGPRQDPNGAYAAVIPLFVKALLENKAPVINGTGENSRDFTFVDNAVHANVLSLFTDNDSAVNQVYNIACGEQLSLVQLFEILRAEAGSSLQPVFGPARQGDVLHSLADISRAKALLEYSPVVMAKEGLARAFQWYHHHNA